MWSCSELYMVSIKCSINKNIIIIHYVTHDSQKYSNKMQTDITGFFSLMLTQCFDDNVIFFSLSLSYLILWSPQRPGMTTGARMPHQGAPMGPPGPPYGGTPPIRPGMPNPAMDPTRKRPTPTPPVQNPPVQNRPRK